MFELYFFENMFTLWTRLSFIFQKVYSISRHIRGRAVLISNTGYQALRLLKDLFIQMNYILSIHVERSANVGIQLGCENKHPSFKSY